MECCCYSRHRLRDHDHGMLHIFSTQYPNAQDRQNQSHACYLLAISVRPTRLQRSISSMFTTCSCIVFALLFITSYSSFLNSSDPGVAVILPAIYQQCNLSSSFILAAILPCFRLLFQSSELIDYPLNPYARNVQRLETPKNNENKSAPAELGIQEK